MRALLKPFLGKYAFSTKKLGIADTAKVIQDKILNITQSVHIFSFRMILKNLEQLFLLEMVLLVYLVLLKYKQDRW
jgi:hypothetical protein